MDESPYKRGPSRLEWAIIIALVVIVVYAVLVLIGQQQMNTFNQINNNF